MCTAVSLSTLDHYFGRNLDLEYGYQETVTVTPRNYPFRFRQLRELNHHYAMIGMATVADGYPLYYEATNEKGLSMAALNFPGNAAYLPAQPDMDNIAPFEAIPWILGQCATVDAAQMLLQRMNMVKIPFSSTLPLSPLHWLISDCERSIVVEPMADGLHIFQNPTGVLTNSPPFDFHLYHLANFMGLSIDPAENRFSSGIELKPYSNGMGGLGLPGDYSSSSRFVRACFVRQNSVCGSSEEQSVSQFFHILSSVAMPRGTVQIRPEEYEITRYSCCCNTTRGIYYYTTYDNSQITGVDMRLEDLDGKALANYALCLNPSFFIQNKNKDGDQP